MTEEELKIENQKINERMIVYKENVNNFLEIYK